MNRVSFLAALLIFAGSANAQTKETGELHLYSHSTQIGIVANREFKDTKGRVVKVIYYGSSESNGPFHEELLMERSIHTYQFDENDCSIKSESFAPGMILTGSGESICFEGTSQAKLVTLCNARGIRTTEIRNILKDGYSSQKPLCCLTRPVKRWSLWTERFPRTLISFMVGVRLSMDSRWVLPLIAKKDDRKSCKFFVRSRTSITPTNICPGLRHY